MSIGGPIETGASFPPSEAPGVDEASGRVAGAVPSAQSQVAVETLAQVGHPDVFLAGKDRDGKAGSGATPPGGFYDLDPPEQDCSPETLSLMIAGLESKIADLQKQSALKGIKFSERQRKAANDDALQKLNAAADKMQKAKEKDKTLNILKLVGESLGVVALVAGAVLSFGTLSAPLMVAVVALTVVMAAQSGMDIAGTVDQMNGGKGFSAASLEGEGFSSLAKDCGASDKQAQEAATWGPIAFQVVLMIGGIVTGVGAARSIQSLSTIMKVANATRAVAQVSQAGTSISSGVVTLQKAGDERDAADSMADKAEDDKAALKMTQRLQNEIEILKKVVEQLNDTLTISSSMLKAADSTQLQIAARIKA